MFVNLVSVSTIVVAAAVVVTTSSILLTAAFILITAPAILLAASTIVVTTPAVAVATAAAKVLPTKGVLEMARRFMLARVILVVVVAVVLVVEVLGTLLGLVLRLLAVNVVGALGLGQAVDFSTRKASEELLSEAVRNGLACWLRQYERGIWMCV